MKLLQDKVALVTGGSRGIGEAIVRKFAEQGANVAFTYVSSTERAEKIVKELKEMGVDAAAFKSDAGSFEQAETLVNEVIENFGKVDILVNNAGISRDNLLLRVTEEQWDEVMIANLKSVFNLTKNVLRPMMKARSGSIINMSSVVGLRGNAGQSSYAASKAGIIGFTKSTALELGSRNIRSNAIAPGFIETDMTDYLKGEDAKVWHDQIALRRFGDAEEIANVALFLASDLSSYVSGQVISACGGMNT